MKIAVLADLHGNLPAVEAVDRDFETRGVDAVYCLGDLIGKGPSSPETMDWALRRCEVILMGNWDEAVCENTFPDAAWYRAQLGEARLRALAALPLEHRFLFSGRRIRLLHGRPVAPDVIYSTSPLEERLSLFETQDGYRPHIVGFADVHQPFFQLIKDTGTLFNTGSVGNPLAQQPYATYVLLEGEMGGACAPLSHTIVQLPYDQEAALRLTKQAQGLPRADAFCREVMTGIYSR